MAGLHPGPSLDSYAAAALTDTTAEEAADSLEQLARAYLMQPVAPGRYGLHDLLRAYAAEQAAGRDPEPDRQQALTRVFDHYLRTAAAAMDIVFPAENPRLADPSSSASPVPPVADPAAARAWLDAHRTILVAVAEYTANHGWPGHSTRLATAVFRYLESGSHFPEIIAIYGHARRAACRAGDRAGEADAHNYVCLPDLRQGRYQQAASHLREALTLYRQAGSQIGQARALGNLGIVEFQQGHYQRASDYHRHALALYRQAGSRAGQARTLNNLGLIDLRQGRYQQASDRLRPALALFRQMGIPPGEALALGNLGRVDLRQGRHQQASDHLRQALALYREAGDLAGQAEALTSLGAVGLDQGRCQQAASQQRQALALFREIGDRSGEAEALNGLGSVFLATGRPGHARTQYTAALDRASQIGDQYQQAHARDGLAHSYHAAGDSAQARRYWEEAITLYAGLGAPEADQIRARTIPAHDDSHHES
jgi:tetratricopeptide (TPR) repeat protein